MNMIKKITLITLGLTGFILAADPLTFYVESPEMVDMYFLIFSAIGRIFSSGEYLDLLRFTFLLGGFMVFAGGIFTSMNVGGGEGAIGGYLKYIIIGVSLLTLLFWRGDTDIVIKSNNLKNVCDPTSSGTQGVAIPPGVPTILAYSYYFTNKVGSTLTKLSEEAYSTVYGDSFQGMSKNGGYMGALRGTMKLLSIDPSKISLRNDNNISGTPVPPFDYGRVYKTLFTDCMLVPYSAKGEAGERELAKLKASSNLTNYISTNLAGTGIDVGGINSRDFSLTYGGEVYTCGNFYDNVIVPMNTAYSGIVACGEPIGYGAVALITGANSVSDITSAFNEVAIQAGLVSNLEESTQNLGVGVSGVAYATGKTRAEFIQSSLASGSYMAEMLPYLQMTIRAILYAFFPFVFVIVLLPGGLKVLGNYFQSLIWVELWTPTAAILDLFMSSQATAKINDIYSNEGMTMMSSVDMLSAGSTIAGVAGYLYLSVPALTWLILKGSAQMMQGITTAAAAGMATNIQTDSINKDVAAENYRKELSTQSGQELSLAESQHFESVQQGRIRGAESGVQMKEGMNTIVDMKAALEQASISNYSTTKSATGEGGVQQGASEGRHKAIKTSTAVEIGKNIKSIDGEGFNVEAKSSIEAGTAEATGKMNAQYEERDMVTGSEGKQFASDIEKTNISGNLAKVETLKGFGDGTTDTDSINKQAKTTADGNIANLHSTDGFTNDGKERESIGRTEGENKNFNVKATDAEQSYLQNEGGETAKTVGKSAAITKTDTITKQDADKNVDFSAGGDTNNDGQISESEHRKMLHVDSILGRQIMTETTVQARDEDGNLMFKTVNGKQVAIMEKTGSDTQSYLVGGKDKNGNRTAGGHLKGTNQVKGDFTQEGYVKVQLAEAVVKKMHSSLTSSINKEESEKVRKEIEKSTESITKKHMADFNSGEKTYEEVKSAIESEKEVANEKITAKGKKRANDRISEMKSRVTSRAVQHLTSNMSESGKLAHATNKVNAIIVGMAASQDNNSNKGFATDAVSSAYKSIIDSATEASSTISDKFK